MFKEPRFPLLDLLTAFTSVLDLVSPKVVGQSKQVSYIAFSIASELGLPRKQLEDLVTAGLLHDIGISSLSEKMGALQIQFENASKHSRIGAQILTMSGAFPSASTLVRFHHYSWENGAGSEFMGEKVPISSHILHLADRIAVLVDGEQEVLGQVDRIIEQIKSQSDKMFMPEMVDSFTSLARKEHFWFDIASLPTGETQLNTITLSLADIDMDGLVQLSKLFSRIIDFRNRFTAMHTSGVGAIAESLATLWGFSKIESIMMQIAGNIHDLGMFSVPAEIMEKPSVLTKEESNVVKKHSYHTFHALEPFENLRTMSEWASFHHERINGSGYPFHLDGNHLSLGSRIMAVADIFTALTEDRPYRKGMTPEDSLAIVEQMANSSTLDPEVIKLLKANFDQINSSRMAIELASTDQYRQLHEQIEPKTKA